MASKAFRVRRSQCVQCLHFYAILLSVEESEKMCCLHEECFHATPRKSKSKSRMEKSGMVRSLFRAFTYCQANSKADTSNLNQTISDFQPKVSKCACGESLYA